MLPALEVKTAPAAPLPWRERWRQWRQARLADPAFRHWASAFPLTRWTARREAAALFATLSGFVGSQVLLACCRSGLLDRLHEGPATASQLAQALGVDASRLRRLLQAAAALDLLDQRDDGLWLLRDRGVVLVSNAALRALVEHHDPFYADLSDPVALLQADRRPTRLAGFWAYGDPQGDPGPYSRLMAASQPLVSEQVLDVVDFTSHRHLLDVGGGDGAFLIAAARRAPHLQLSLWDLPAVAARAQHTLHAAGLATRVRVFGGSFFDARADATADVATLVRVLHDHDDDQALRLLQAVRHSLPAGATLFIAEPLAGTPGAGACDAYFAAYFLCMGRGQLRRADEVAALLQRSGFGAIDELATRQPLVARVLKAVAA